MRVLSPGGVGAFAKAHISKGRKLIEPRADPPVEQAKPAGTPIEVPAGDTQ